MEKIVATLEMGKDGYGVWFNDISNVYAFGETVEEAKKEAKEALEYFIEISEKSNKTLPKALQGEYELVFEFDTEALLKHVGNIVTQKALSKASLINPAQLSLYSSGQKKPRREQRERIINGIHKLAKELSSVS